MDFLLSLVHSVDLGEIEYLSDGSRHFELRFDLCAECDVDIQRSGAMSGRARRLHLNK